MLVALNCFLRFTHLESCCVKLLKIQQQILYKGEKELTRKEYQRLIRAGQGTRISYIIQTTCGTGIRVSELQERVYQGKYKVLYYDSEIYRGESPDLPFCLLLCQCLLFLSHCKQSVKE